MIDWSRFQIYLVYSGLPTILRLIFYVIFMIIVGILAGSILRSDSFFGAFGSIAIGPLSIADRFAADIASLSLLLLATIFVYRGVSTVLDMSRILGKLILFIFVLAGVSTAFSIGFQLENSYVPYSRAYFLLHKDTILKNMKEDSVTHIFIYVLNFEYYETHQQNADYTTFEHRRAPSHFYVDNRNGALDKLIYCLETNYITENVAAQIFFVVLAGEYPEPCLAMGESQ